MSNLSLINAGVIILVAGISRRMGCSKALLTYNRGQTFLEKIVNEYSNFGCAEIIVIVNTKIKEENWELVIDKLHQNVQFVNNEHLEYERFYSVKLGIQKLIASEYCFIQNIDNPFVDIELLRTIYNHKIKDGYVSPRYKGEGGHPILLGKEVINGIKATQENNLNFRKVMANYNCEKVETQNQNILININTTEEYNRYFKAGN